jgi:hypothetical protein
MLAIEHTFGTIIIERVFVLPQNRRAASSAGESQTMSELPDTLLAVNR